MKRDYKQSENELRQSSRLPYVFSKATWNGRVSGADPELDLGRVLIRDAGKKIGLGGPTGAKGHLLP